MLKEYDYNKYFDLANGARSIEFEGYSGRFNPDEYDYFVYDVKKEKENQVSFKFFFDGSLGQWSDGAHYLLEIKFIGSILCDDVKEFKQEDCKTEKTIFKIKKELFNKDKIIQIENEEVGKISIKCGKLYAQKIDAYSHREDGKWELYGEESHEQETVENNKVVYLEDCLKDVPQHKYLLPIILGKDLNNNVRVKDLHSIPSILIAGSTGTGKSVFLDSVICTLMAGRTSKELKFVFIDPKMSYGMKAYERLPYTLFPVINDSYTAYRTLVWCVGEMEMRKREIKYGYSTNIEEYNKKDGNPQMPYIVIIIDEFANLMLSEYSKEIETMFARLASAGEKLGIHLILSTSSPRDTVVTEKLKESFPGRIAFALASSIDSEKIIDEKGAEDLLGNGDMLYKDSSTKRSMRLQSPYTSTEYIASLGGNIARENGIDDTDLEFFDEAKEYVIATQKASASMLQRKFRIGYNRASGLIDKLEELKIISKEDGAKPRKVLVKG